MFRLYPLQFVFISSFSVLFFEILLIRIFSVRFSYHFASIIIGISIFGIVLGSLFVHTRKKAIRITTKQAFIALSFLFPVQFALSYLLPFDHLKLLWDRLQVVYLILQVILILSPFFSYGLFISLCFREYPKISARIYGVDLLGAANGAILAPYALDILKPELCLGILFLIICSASIFLPRRSLLVWSTFIISATLSILVLVSYIEIPISEYKSLTSALKMPGARLLKSITSRDSRIDVLENPHIRYAPGLSLTYSGNIPAGLIISKDGEIAGVFLDEAKGLDNHFYEFLPSFTPYVLKKRPENVLVIGLKSSIEVLIAHKAKPKNLFVTEKDRSLHRFIEEFYDVDSVHRRSLIRKNAREFVKKLVPSWILLSFRVCNISPLELSDLKKTTKPQSTLSSTILPP